MNLISQLRSTGSLLESVNAVTHWPAMALFAATSVLVALILGLCMAAGNFFLLLFGALLVLLIGIYGFGAVGILFMSEMRTGEILSPLDAVFRSLNVSHRLLGVALLAALSVMAMVIVVTVLVLVCKIPVLGPILYVFVMPFSVVLLGTVCAVALYIYLPLAAPAVWSGLGVLQAYSSLFAIARRKLLPVILQMLVLMMIAAVVFFIIGIILGLGLSGTMGISLSVLGDVLERGAQSHFSMVGSSYMASGFIGMSVLFALTMIVPGLIAMHGACRIYLNAVEGLDMEQAEGELQVAVGQLREKADDARCRAENMATTVTAAARKKVGEAKQKISEARQKSDTGTVQTDVGTEKEEQDFADTKRATQEDHAPTQDAQQQQEEEAVREDVSAPMDDTPADAKNTTTDKGVA